MGWGKTLLAGVGGFIVAGPVGAAVAAGAVAAGSKMMEAKKEEENTSQQAANNEQSREQLMQQRAKRLEAQKQKEAEENRRLEAERKKAEAEAAKASAEREQFLIAFIAVGIATASVDGDMSAEEKHELLEVLNAIKGEGELPDKVQKQLKVYEENPPTFMQAKKEVCKLENPDTKFFRSLIESIIHSDNDVSEEEEDFLAKWDYYYPQE